MTSGIVSVNGQVSSIADAKIGILDRGFLYGDSVFEVCVGFQSTILDLDAHLDRLDLSAGELDMTLPWSRTQLRNDLLELSQQFPCDKKNIRLIVTRGEGLGLGRHDSDPVPNKVIIITPAHVEDESLQEKGLVLRTKSLGFTERGPAAKTSNYLRSILALRHLTASGVDDVLWINASSEITEASTANIFFLGREGDLLEIATPHTNSGILAGITRATLVQLLNAANIPVTERIIYNDEIPRFDEAFVCSTVRGLVPVVQIDQHRLHTTRAKSIYQEIKRLYSAHVTRELGYAVDWNTGKPQPSIGAKPLSH